MVDAGLDEEWRSRAPSSSESLVESSLAFPSPIICADNELVLSFMESFEQTVDRGGVCCMPLKGRQRNEVRAWIGVFKEARIDCISMLLVKPSVDDVLTRVLLLSSTSSSLLSLSKSLLAPFCRNGLGVVRWCRGLCNDVNVAGDRLRPAVDDNVDKDCNALVLPLLRMEVCWMARFFSLDKREEEVDDCSFLLAPSVTFNVEDDEDDCLRPPAAPLARDDGADDSRSGSSLVVIGCVGELCL